MSNGNTLVFQILMTLAMVVQRLAKVSKSRLSPVVIVAKELQDR